MSDPTIVPPVVAPSTRQSNSLNLFRPNLAASLPSGNDSDLEKLDWAAGMMASPKIDGIRGIKHPELGLVSRTLKPIPNRHIQSVLSSALLDHMDGELVVGDLENLVDYNSNQSAIMSRDGTPNFSYCVFDNIDYPNITFAERQKSLAERVSMHCVGLPIILVEQRRLYTMDELMEYEEEVIARGFEGVIIRHPHRPYKNNRSTFREQGMIKLKRFTDAEAEIVGFEELQRNLNEPTRDNLGYQKRSNHLSGQVAANTLGKLLVKGINGRFAGIEFKMGSGLDDGLRRKIWNHQHEYEGRIVKYKFQDHGSKDKPRSPIFLGFRDRRDM